MEEEVKYVHFKGHAQIGISPEGNLTLVLFDDLNKPINEDDPFIFLDIPTGTQKRLKIFDSSGLIGQFTEEAFARNLSKIQKIHPGLTWETAESPEPETMPHMNPTGPPR